MGRVPVRRVCVQQVPFLASSVCLRVDAVERCVWTPTMAAALERRVDLRGCVFSFEVGVRLKDQTAAVSVPELVAGGRTGDAGPSRY